MILGWGRQEGRLCWAGGWKPTEVQRCTDLQQGVNEAWRVLTCC